MSRHDRDQPRRVSLLVRNLPLDARPEDVRAKFERYGEVRDIYMPKDYYTNRPRGFGFIEFHDSRDADEAMRHLDHTNFMGREITVCHSKESRKTPRDMIQRERAYGGGGGGGGGGGYNRGGYDRDRDRGYDRDRHRRSRSRSRSRGRGRRDSRSRSRGRGRSYSRSPRRDRRQSRSPRRDRSASRSPRRDRSASRSPRRDRSASRSPRRDRSASRSPQRDRSASRSPQRDQSASPARGADSPSHAHGDGDDAGTNGRGAYDDPPEEDVPAASDE